MSLPTSRVISFHYTLKDESGKVLESSFGNDPLSFIEGQNQIVPGLESSLRFLNIGDKRSVEVKAKEAYGEYDSKLVAEIPRQAFPEGDINVGDTFHAATEDGQMQIVFIKEVHPEHVKIDGNHPLSGKDLHFDVEVVAIRNATQEEMAHGHVHGLGGITH